MKWLMLVLALGQLYGCGAGLKRLANSPDFLPADPSLWQVNIGRGESSIFTGLLVLKPEGDELRAVLLDSMGLKLLEERIGKGGKVEVVSAIPLVKSKRLPSFLGEGIYRLFLVPGVGDGEACRSDGFAVAVCLGEKEAGHLVKLRRRGPFVLWSGDYFINNYATAGDLKSVRLNSGWLVPYLHLEKKDTENGMAGK